MIFFLLLKKNRERVNVILKKFMAFSKFLTCDSFSKFTFFVASNSDENLVHNKDYLPGVVIQGDDKHLASLFQLSELGHYRPCWKWPSSPIHHSLPKKSSQPSSVTNGIVKVD